MRLKLYTIIAKLLSLIGIRSKTLNRAIGAMKRRGKRKPTGLSAYVNAPPAERERMAAGLPEAATARQNELTVTD